MKNLILITFMSFLCLAATYADHRDERENRNSYGQNSQFFSYEGGDDYQNVTLVDLEEVWVTETREVRSTCTRSVPVTRRVCREVRPSYGHGHGHGHRPPPRQECRTETTYRTENYTCYKPETFRTRRPDKRYHANISVEFKNLSWNRHQDGRADFFITLNKDRVTLNLQRQYSRNENIFFMKDELRTSRWGDVTEISGQLKVLVMDRIEFLKPIHQSIDVRPEVHHGELVLKTGKIVFEKGLDITLRLSGDRGRTLFQGQIPKDFISIREGRFGDESIIIIDLDRLLHGTLRRGDYLHVDLTLSLLDKNLTLLNNQNLPSLEQSVRSSVSIR